MSRLNTFWGVIRAGSLCCQLLTITTQSIEQVDQSTIYLLSHVYGLPSSDLLNDVCIS